MTDKYSDLKRSAEAQPEREWSVLEGYESCKEGTMMYHLCGPEGVSDYEDWGFTKSSADYIALANPAAVLELLADLDEAQLELSGVETAKKDLAEVLGCADEPRWKWLYCNASELVRQNEKLKAEAESLRPDAERYRWLRDYHIGDDSESINLEPAGRRGLSQAIDAAMKKDPQS